MSRLKAKPETAQMLPEVRETASDSVTLMAARADMTPHHSPALALQASLEQSWGARHGRDAAQVTKIPFGWTLIGMSVVCAAFWYALLHLVF
ncbi:hypothetical protein [Asticcacaulis sp.]|uniref:hypothetical protein n=1 Tax=Asticcacaulis sp. TaxID=1872648 RepID=UPI002C278159|nr:hypothetical protein [Asticcacaulis sp.]HTM82619.1 hypothetical protein [Asticcacaulis sp.]